MSIEKFGFFSSIEQDRLYTDDDFAGYFKKFLTSGIFPLPEHGLLVETDDTGANLVINPGSAWIEGRFYELERAKTLSLEIGDELLDRIDYVVIRCDYVNREISAGIKKGEASSDPQPPELQRDSDAYELAICKYKIKRGATAITNEALTDTRKDLDLAGEVCSIIDKHTLKEFCKVSGFSMTGDINTKNLIPTDNKKSNLGSPEKKYNVLYAKKIEVEDELPYIAKTGGTLTGTLNTLDLIPSEDNTSNLGSSNKRYSNIYATNLNVSGEHPFFAKTGGTITGGVRMTYKTSGEGDYQLKLVGYDEGGDSIFGYNEGGKVSHILRGKGNFIVENPVINLTDTRVKKLSVNSKKLYIQSSTPSVSEGAVWIKI